ncbi:pilus assembly protein TadG-related protein [Planotetraspora silvatica]
MSVFVVVFSLAVFLLAGLLVDGGAAINARLKAADIAEQAARGAADQIDVPLLRNTGQVRLLGDDDVCAKAEQVVDAQAAEGVAMEDCSPTATEVTVVVSAHWDTVFLSMLGFDAYDMEGSAIAAPDEGA